MSEVTGGPGSASHRQQLAHRLGRYGTRPPAMHATPAFAVHAERLGFGALWVGGSPPADLRGVEGLLDATSSMVVATGVVNIWESPARKLAASYARITRRHPRRLILGIGFGHSELNGVPPQRPIPAMRGYIEELTDRGVPVQDIVIAALGPNMLELAAERTAGAHPYLVTTRHTAEARAIVGRTAFLAPEQRVVLDQDRSRARRRARPGIANPYLGLANYRANWLRLGYRETDLEDGGSDRLIDDLVVSGDEMQIRAGLNAHLAAGADHVAMQVVAADEDLDDQYARVAAIVMADAAAGEVEARPGLASSGSLGSS